MRKLGIGWEMVRFQAQPETEMLRCRNPRDSFTDPIDAFYCSTMLTTANRAQIDMMININVII